MTETTPAGSLRMTASMSWPSVLWLSPCSIRAAEAAKRQRSAAPAISPRAWVMGLPDSSVSISAKRSTSPSIRSATFRSTAARALAGRRDQRPSSKARRAAAMAASVSAMPPLAAVLTTTPCEGETRSEVAPSALST